MSNNNHTGLWKKLLCGSLFLILSSQLTTLNSQTLWERFTNWLTSPRNVDSTYIYQQSMGFSPSLTFNISRQSVRLSTTETIEDMPYIDGNFNAVLDEFGDTVFVDLLLSVINKIEESISSRVGFNLSYGRLGAGWSFELAPDSSQRSSTFLFSFHGNQFGLNINYLGFSQKMTEDVRWLPQGIFGLTDSYDTIPTGNRVRRLTVDGYYVINPRRFAYPPGIAGNMIQLRSAGSWMLAGRFLQSDLNLDNYIARFGMSQLSLGVGYSYTWVPFSRTPRYANNQSDNHFSFFINGTIIPMLTVYNHLTVEPDQEMAELFDSGEKGSFCWPTPNILANATIGISWSKFYLGAQFNYNVFHFNTRNAISSNNPLQNSGIETMGVFYEWNLGFKFQACF